MIEIYASADYIVTGMEGVEINGFPGNFYALKIIDSYTSGYYQYQNHCLNEETIEIFRIFVVRLSADATIFSSLSHFIFIMDLTEILRLDYPVSDETVAKILDVSEIKVVHKGQYIIEQGKRNYDMVLFLEGAFRLGYTHDGKDYTWAFGGTSIPWLSIETLVRNEPARFSLITITESKILFLNFKNLCRLTEECIDFLKWQHKALLKQIYYLCYRETIITIGNAYERYAKFVANRNEEYVKNIPLKYIAQYLNLTPETVSRVRKCFNKNQ